MKIVIAGATGFIGKALVKDLLSEGHSLLSLSRKAGHSRDARLQTELWDGRTQGAWAGHLDGADAVINLAGEGIGDKRWSPERKKRLLSSRLDATNALVQAIGNCSRRPKVLVNASAVGFYGNVPNGEVTEAHLKGNGFLSDVCAAWEKEAAKAELLGLRVVLLRFGVVIGEGGGALQKFIPPFRFFAGGPLGSGHQYFPWVHRDDAVGAIVYTLNNDRLSGPINVTAPEGLTMAQFCRALGKAMHRPSWAPVPGLALKILLGEMSDMILTGQRALPKRLQEAGYRFQYPQAAQALEALFQK